MVTFEARWYDAAGRRHSASYDTAAEADQARQERLRERRRGDRYLEACATCGGRAPSGQALARFFPWAASEADLVAWSIPPPVPAPQ